MTKKDLIAFENKIARLFREGKIHAPIHLAGNNEDQLIKIFEESIKPWDWVFSTHRSHYHALLHGIPADWLEKEILAGRSMHIFSEEHKFFTSAIVGGTLPIAVGVAFALKRQRRVERVWVFIGDGASETGLFWETAKFACSYGLPIIFVVEDNSYSVNTHKKERWGTTKYLLDLDIYYV